jgi:arylsulfatase A-like enzyme
MADRSVQELARCPRSLVALLLTLLAGCGDDPLPPRPPATAPDTTRYAMDGSLRTPAAPGPRPDLLIVVIPELRADHCGSATKGAKHDAAPRIAALADAGDAFGHAITPVLDSGAALASLLTGLMPERHGVSHLDTVPRLVPGFVGLGEVLKNAAGYATRAFVFPERLARAATLWQGFDVEPGIGLEQAPERVATWFAGVPKGTPRAAVLMADALFKHDRARHFGQDFGMEADMREQYAAAVELADAWLGALLDRLVKDGHAGNLLVVVTSTSGTALLERKKFGPAAGLHDETLRIPLVFGGSVYLAGEGATHKTASLVDVFPTLLDMLGLPEPDVTDGVSLEQVLLGAVRRGPVRAVHLVDGSNSGDKKAMSTIHATRSLRWKYMVTLDQRAGTVVESAFDLDADPDEKNDLAKDGSVGHVEFDASFCDGVEAVRDLVWASAAGHNALVEGPYNQGTRVLQGRPKPCAK